MRRDLGTLQIEKLIVHEVPKRLVHSEPQTFALSEIESPLTQELKNYFTERISDSLSAASFGVIFDPEETPIISDVVFDCINRGAERFVENSQAIAQHLYNCQNGNNPGGLLVVTQAIIEDRQAIAILKLEKDQAIRLEQMIIDNKNTFNLHHMRNLTMSERTRVFKVGLFVQEGTAQEHIQGIVCDKQRGNQGAGGVAEFFLKKFLGCRLREEPEVATKRFYELAQQFINEKVADPVRKAQYFIGVMAELNSTAVDITPREFVRQHLEVADRQPFLETLEAGNFTEPTIPKNNALINSQLKKMHWDFASGIIVVASPEAFQKQVTVNELEDGKTSLEIVDRVRRVR